MRVATATMLCDTEADVVRSFVRYHHAIGIDHVFLVFDRGEDPAFEAIAGMPGVTCLRRGPELAAEEGANGEYERTRGFLASEVMARQCLATGVALARARAMGLDWLVHLDIDELLYVPGLDARPLFAAAAERGAEQIVFHNHEAIPETEQVGDYFREVSLFKQNPQFFTAGPAWKDSAWARRGWFFNGYTIGKAAVRVAIEPRVDGPHRFLARDGRALVQTLAHDGVVLHYLSCGLDRYVQKYRTLGRFADRWFEAIPIEQPFHLGSRDRVLAGERADVIDYYRTHVLMRGVDLERERERGYLLRVAIPPAMFDGGPAGGS